MMPSLYGVVRNINNVRSSKTLVAGCTLTVAAVLVATSVVQACGSAIGYNYGSPSGCDSGCGLTDGNYPGGGDLAAYQDGGYGGYPNGYDQGNYVPPPPSASTSYSNNTPFYYNGTWNAKPTPAPTLAGTGGGDGSMPPPIDDAGAPGPDYGPVDDGSGMPPVDDSGLPPDQGDQGGQPVPEQQPAPQNENNNSSNNSSVNKAIATVTVKTTPTVVKATPVATKPATVTELPVTGSSSSPIVAGVGAIGLTTAAAYYLVSRREMLKMGFRR